MACFPKRVPQPEPELGRAVQLPAQLTDVGHAQGKAWHGPDGQLLGRHEGKPRVGYVSPRELLENRARIRSPKADAGIGRRDVLDVDRAVIRPVVANPRQIVHAERRASDNAEPMLAEPGDW